MTSTTDAPPPADRFIKVRGDGAATGSVYHYAECGFAANIEPEERYVLSDTEIKLLGLSECKTCFRLTHKPGVEESLKLLKEAVREAMTIYRQGRPNLAEKLLSETLDFIEGRAERPDPAR